MRIGRWNHLVLCLVLLLSSARSADDHTERQGAGRLVRSKRVRSLLHSVGSPGGRALQLLRGQFHGKHSHSREGIPGSPNDCRQQRPKGCTDSTGSRSRASTLDILADPPWQPHK